MEVIADGFDAVEDVDEILTTVTTVLVDPALLEPDALLTAELLALGFETACDAEELEVDLDACPTGVLKLDDRLAEFGELEVDLAETDDDDCAEAELEEAVEVGIDVEVTGQTVVPTETTLVTVTVDCMLEGQLTTAAGQLVTVEVCVE